MTDDRRLVARSAAAIYAGATLVGLVEAITPGGVPTALLPSIVAPVVMVVALLVGRHLPRPALIVFGALGAALIAVALATTRGSYDGAALYMWPAVWTAYFYGTRGTAFIVAWIAAVHAAALWHADAGAAGIDRWIDVVAAVVVVALFVRLLAARNQRLLARLSDEASRDPLTGLLNRRALQERLVIEADRAARDAAPLAVVTFDLDDFKAINDRDGHEAGDRVLEGFARLLNEQARGVDLVARIGGDEFLAVLPGADEEDALGFGERVRGRAHGTGVTVSAGVAAERPPVVSERLLKLADRALYRAKAQGRDAVAGRVAPA